MSLESDVNEAIRQTFITEDANKYNIAIGFFQSYAVVNQDTSGKRYCNLKLHFKSKDAEDIDITEVPLLCSGSINAIDEFPLEKGDEMRVFFSDRTLEQWNPKTNTEPQTLANTVKDSLNHAFCIPFNSHHNDFSLPIDSTVGRRHLVKSGKKIQIGNNVDELLKNTHDFMNIIGSLSFTDGDSLAAALTAQLTAINLIVTSMANITKI